MHAAGKPEAKRALRRPPRHPREDDIKMVLELGVRFWIGFIWLMIRIRCCFL
jgi:hypothetical protein